MSTAYTGMGGSVTLGSKLSEVVSWEITVDVDAMDATSMDSGGWKETKGGLKSWSGNAEFRVSPGDVIGSSAIGTFVTTSATGSKTFTGTALVNRVTPTARYNELVGWRIEFTGSGPLTVT